MTGIDLGDWDTGLLGWVWAREQACECNVIRSQLGFTRRLIINSGVCVNDIEAIKRVIRKKQAELVGTGAFSLMSRLQSALNYVLWFEYERGGK